MADREKVIKGLEACMQSPTDEEKQNYICACDECPYFREYSPGECIYTLYRDALELLKSQREYETAVEMEQYCEKYEPTYNSEDGSM